MKHKKFVKQLMAAGLPRNAANKLAQHVQRFRWPYFKALGDFLTGAAIRQYNAMTGSVVCTAPGTNLWEDLARKVGGGYE